MGSEVNSGGSVTLADGCRERKEAQINTNLSPDGGSAPSWAENLGAETVGCKSDDPVGTTITSLARWDWSHGLDPAKSCALTIT